MLGATEGDGVVGEVGDGLEDLAEAVVGGEGCGFEGLELGFEGAGLVGEGGGVCSGATEGGDLFGELVAMGLEGLGASDGVAAVAVDGVEVAEDDGWVCSAGAQFFFYQRQVGTDEC